MCKPAKYLDPEVLKAVLNYNPTTGLFSRKFANQSHPAGYIYSPRNPGEYITVPYGKSSARAGRAAYVMMTGEQPIIIDHINGIPHDNRWCNLRSVTVQENSQNRKAVRIKNGTYVPLE